MSGSQGSKQLDPWSAPDRVEPFAGDHRPPLWLLFVLPGLVAAVVTWSTWPDYSNCVTYGPLGGLDLLGAFVAHGLALVGASYAVLLSLRAPHIRRWSLVAQCTLVLFLLTTVSLAYVATVHGFWPPPTPDCKNVAL